MTVVQVAGILLLMPLAMVFWHSALAGWVGLLSGLAAIVSVCFIHLWLRDEGKRQTFYGKTKVPLAVTIADQLMGLAISSTAGFAIRADYTALATGIAAVVLMGLIWRRRTAH